MPLMIPPDVTVEVQVEFWEASSNLLELRVRVPALGKSHTWYRRKSTVSGWGWYTTPNHGERPSQDLLAPVLNRLVCNHPDLGAIAHLWGIE